MASSPKPEVSIQEQLACAQRELRLRRQVYPRWVAAKRMNVFKAEDETRAMEAIIETLQALADKKTPRLL